MWGNGQERPQALLLDTGSRDPFGQDSFSPDPFASNSLAPDSFVPDPFAANEGESFPLDALPRQLLVLPRPDSQQMR